MNDDSEDNNDGDVDTVEDLVDMKVPPLIFQPATDPVAPAVSCE